MKIQKLSIIVVLAAAWGCAGNDSVNIGDDKTQSTKTGALLSDYAASWDGYTEAHKFASGSDRVQIELDDEGHGTVVLGSGAPPAPATDPEAYYSPVGDVGIGPFGWPSGQLGEGFAYTIQHAEVQQKRIRFGIDPNEVYRSWCELQVPVHNTAPEGPEYGCLPYFTSAHGDATHCWIQDPVSEEDVEVNCAKTALCGANPTCTCTADGCTVAPLASADATFSVFDAALDDGGDSLEGTFGAPSGVIVRMERQ